jgi:type IV secretion system protein VirB6
MACPSLEQGSGFVSGMLRFVDCEVQTIGAGGYQALTAPGSTFQIVLTGLLTLFVALFGYRMLLGHVPTIREGVLALVKVGIVLALTASWPAYRTLVYDVALRAPAELSAQIGGAASLPGASGGMVGRLEGTDSAMVALALAGVGPVALDQRAPSPFAGFDAFALGGSRILFLIGVVGAFATVRLIAGLCLAIAPLFIAFLLFDATRGLFEGWLRVLAGAALGALGTSIVLRVELALLEPWLTSLLAARAAGLAIPNAPAELIVVTTIFCVVLAAMIWAMARLAMGFRLAPVRQALSDALGSARGLAQTQPVVPATQTQRTVEERSRAIAVADAVAASQRREPAIAGAALDYSGARTTHQALARDTHAPTMAPLGQSYRRRTASRVSASAGRRDRA